MTEQIPAPKETHFGKLKTYPPGIAPPPSTQPEPPAGPPPPTLDERISEAERSAQTLARLQAESEALPDLLKERAKLTAMEQAEAHTRATGRQTKETLKDAAHVITSWRAQLSVWLATAVDLSEDLQAVQARIHEAHERLQIATEAEQKATGGHRGQADPRQLWALAGQARQNADDIWRSAGGGDPALDALRDVPTNLLGRNLVNVLLQELSGVGLYRPDGLPGLVIK